MIFFFARVLHRLLHPFSLRSPFVMPPLLVRSYRWSVNGLTTDLERTYNGPTLERDRIFINTSFLTRQTFSQIFFAVLVFLFIFALEMSNIRKSSSIK